MRKFLRSESTLQIGLISLVAFLAVAGAVWATTTIGTNITTGGSIYATSSLVVTGGTTLYSTLTATTTVITANNDQAAVLTVRQDEATGNILTLKDSGTPVFWIGPSGIVYASSTLLVTGATTHYSTLTATTTVITANNDQADVLTVRQDEATLNILTLKDSAINVLTVGPTGNVVVQPSAVSPTAFSVKVPTTGKPIFDVDTTNSLASTTALFVPQSGTNTPRFNASSTGVSIGNGTKIANVFFGTCQVTYGNILASTTAVANCTATGVASGDKVFVTPNISNSNIIFSSASSTAAGDIIQIAVYNTGVIGTVNPDDNYWSWMAVR